MSAVRRFTLQSLDGNVFLRTDSREDFPSVKGTSLGLVFLDRPQFSGRPLPVVLWGRHRSALAVAGPRAEERRHQQAAVRVRQDAVREVERGRSSDPQSVRQLVSGPSGARRGDHGHVWSSRPSVKTDGCFRTHFVPSSSTWTPLRCDRLLPWRLAALPVLRRKIRSLRWSRWFDCAAPP